MRQVGYHYAAKAAAKPPTHQLSIAGSPRLKEEALAAAERPSMARQILRPWDLSSAPHATKYAAFGRSSDRWRNEYSPPSVHRVPRQPVGLPDISIGRDAVRGRGWQYG